jgi:hypothetical protein
VHVFGVDAFKRVVPSDKVRSMFVNLIRWGSTPAEINQSIKFRPDFALSDDPYRDLKIFREKTVTFLTPQHTE